MDAVEVRRYLLGEADERGSATIERTYMDDPDALEQVAAIEDALIEDYLGNRLASVERDRFERHYLSSRRRRMRVDTVRRLIAAAAQAPAGSPAALPALPQRRWRSSWSWPFSIAAAAALAAVIGGVTWMTRSSPPASAPPSAASAPPPLAVGRTPAPPAPHVFAFTLSPVGVRSGDDRPGLVIPDAIDIVAIDLERGDGPRPGSARAVVRKVSGEEVWSGVASAANNLAPAIAARLEIPAARLPPDDYTITLISTAEEGREREVNRYFLRVRTH